MQQSDGNQFYVNQGATVAARDFRKVGEVTRDATVSVLTDRIPRHVASVDSNAPRLRAREGKVDIIAPPRCGASLSPRHNLLLAGLNAADYASLVVHLDPVPLPCGFVVCHAHHNADYVYFPISGIVSILYELEDGASMEVAVTGNDGVVGVAAFMGGGATTSRAVVRNEGYAYRVRASVLNGEFDNSPLLRRSLLSYAQALFTQIAQSAVCHRHHQLQKQFCRMLLTTFDRLPTDEVALTHDAMASLLGVRRESITAAAGRLQADGLIRYHRGKITVLDRPAMEAQVCECYGVVKNELNRLMPQVKASASVPLRISRQRHNDAAIFLGARAS